jgi:tetratricopeptide (TPR) repeat protein
MTARLGVADAFELSWERLNEYAQHLGCLLSLFASADIPWDLVKLAYSNMPSSEDEEIDLDILEEARADLVRLNLLQRTGEGTYRLHQLIREFLWEKREESTKVNAYKQGFVAAMVGMTRPVSESPTHQEIQGLAYAMPHVAEVAKDRDLRDCLNDDDLVLPFIGLGRFYQGQGLYTEAEPWYRQCLSITQSRFGSNHPYVAASLSNLAVLHQDQGRYSEAEPLLKQALEILKRLLGADYPQMATNMTNWVTLYLAVSLNNLATLYLAQNRAREVEPVVVQALEILKRFLGSEHPHIATSLNTLAFIYQAQGRYSEAETLLLQALELSKRLFGADHPRVATIQHNLVSIYIFQRRYNEAEPLMVQALELQKLLLGSDHPDVARSLNTLATLYCFQGRYSQAEPLLMQAVELAKRRLGSDHPHVATSLYNLAGVYHDQGRYNEAEPLLSQALEIYQRQLGLAHPQTVNCRRSLARLSYIINFTDRNLT